MAFPLVSRSFFVTLSSITASQVVKATLKGRF